MSKHEQKVRIDSMEMAIEKAQQDTYVTWPEYAVTLPTGQRDKDRVQRLFSEVIASQPDSFWSVSRIPLAARLAFCTLEVDKIHTTLIAAKYKQLSGEHKPLLALMTSLTNERDRLARALKLTTLSPGDYELLRDEKKTFGGTRVKKTNGDSDDIGLRLLA